MAEKRLIVRDSYNLLDERYARWAASLDDVARDTYLICHLNALDNDARMLDLGCGDGALVTARLAQRFAVTGVDFSIVQLRRAARTIAGIDLICADMCELHMPGETFDAVAAFYALTHLPPEDARDLIFRIVNWLKPGGLFVGSLGATADSGSLDADWLGVEMYFSGLGQEANRTLFNRAGFTIERESLETTQEFGRPVSFHWIVAQKPQR